jgi:G3E family GTPase
MAESKKYTPLTILTGYLGAGKTTLLNRILNANHGLKVAVLVNDFGAINIDSKLITNVNTDKISLSNGCICCTISDDLVATVHKLLDTTNPEYIIIEASGVSDPSQIVLTINRSNLRSRVQIDSIVAVVDAEQFRDIQGKAERLLVDQIRVADLVILNKIDLVNAPTLKKAHDWVNKNINRARILEAVECNVPLDAVLGIGTYNPQTAFGITGHGVHVHDMTEMSSHEHHDHSLVFGTWSWQSFEPLMIEQLRHALDELPKSIFRVKGTLYLRETPDKQVILQMVGKRVSLTEGEAWGKQKPYSEIILIGEHENLNTMALSAAFDLSIAPQEQKTELEGMVNGVLKWLRLK